MSDTYTQVAPDSTGDKIDGTGLTVSGQTVVRQRVDTHPMTIIHSSATITATGSTVVEGLGAKTLALLIETGAAPTGTTPTITFSIQDVNPIDLTTVLGQATTGATISTATTQVLTHNAVSGAVKVSWTVTGTTPSFTVVDVAVQPKGADRPAPQGATKSNVTAAAASTSILAANSQRAAAMVFNDSTTNLYLDLSGGTASATSFSVKIPPGVLYEFPYPAVLGAITGIGETGVTGTWRVTELS
jgi:hypothetical protein